MKEFRYTLIDMTIGVIVECNDLQEGYDQLRYETWSGSIEGHDITVEDRGA